MKKEVALKILNVTQTCSVELSGLVPYLKQNCENDEEYEVWGKKIAKLMASIYFDIDSSVYENHPELKPEDLE